MKKILFLSLVLLAGVMSKKGRAATFDKADPEVCAKVAEAVRAGDAEAKAFATALQDEGVCSAKQLGL
ncbi:MAG: hypothetical protein LBO78_01830 [Rickettsiales bacterium]|jgi:hypothetical protein|nr:hypothetical protein [Rickettsiales bacterium]